MTSKIDNAMYGLHHFDALASRDQWMNRKHPLVKFAVTIIYIAVLLSFHKYDLAGVLSMAVYPLAGFLLSDLPVLDSLKRMRAVLPILLAVGILNPFFDRTALQLGVFTVRGGSISMITLMLKGVFSLMAGYLLIATTRIESLCYSLEMLRVPSILVTQLMLTYRYLFLLLGEVNRITQAYTLRAPGQKGVHFKAWGSLAGQLLLRSIDRAQLVYESMSLRGFHGSFAGLGKTERMKGTDLAYLIFWVVLLVLFRRVPVIMTAGNFLGGIL